MTAPEHELVPEALVLDLHGVLLSKTAGYHEAFVRTLDLPPDVWLRLKKSYLEDADAWSRVERGELTLEQFAAELSRLVTAASGRLSHIDAATIWGNPHPFAKSVTHTGLLTFLAGLSPQLPKCIATNNIREWRPHWMNLMSRLDLFDHIFDSSTVGARKPEPMFWQHVEDALAVEPRRIAFVDDRIEMVAGAAQRGWQALQFQSEQQTIDALKGLGINGTVAS